MLLLVLGSPLLLLLWPGVGCVVVAGFCGAPRGPCGDACRMPVGILEAAVACSPGPCRRWVLACVVLLWVFVGVGAGSGLVFICGICGMCGFVCVGGYAADMASALACCRVVANS